jgi:hypothetical protein
MYVLRLMVCKLTTKTLCADRVRLGQSARAARLTEENSCFVALVIQELPRQ